MSWIKKITIQLSIALLFFELFSFVATKFDLFLVNDTPRIYLGGELHSINSDFIGRTENEPWGAWREPNRRYRHIKRCFNVEIQTNEIGARDSAFNTMGDDSIFLLGDSFAEGFGVSQELTSQFLLERTLGREILNFGSAGSFGPLQELMLYREFQDKYNHSGLIVYILLANDFTDNDAKVWAEKNSNARSRYRPYFSEGADPLEPWYFPEAIARRDNFRNVGVDAFSHTTLVQGIKNTLVNYFWISNALRTAAYLIVERNAASSQYYDSLEYQQENFLRAHSGLVDLAGDKPVMFVLIPAEKDITRYIISDQPSEYREQTWYQGLLSLAENDNVALFDLMEVIPSDYENLFHTCDGHWGIQGNRWAAENIIRAINSENFF
jgi:hypothetical protein